jgi:WD40 repeat protein
MRRLQVLVYLAILPAGVGAQSGVDFHGDPLPNGAIARLGTTRLRHDSAVSCLAFSPDNKVRASGGDGGVRLWQVGTWKLLHHLGEGSRAVGSVPAVAFSPNGAFIATGEAGGVVLWEPSTGRWLKQLGRLLEGVYTIAISPDGQTIVYGGRDGIVSCDSVATGKAIARFQVPGRVACVAFSPDGRLLASATTGGKVQVRDFITRQ